MLDFKLISADNHIGEHPDAWARARHEFGDRAPRVVEDPPGLGKGLWIIAEHLEPMRCAFFSMGYVVAKPNGRQQMTIFNDMEKFRQTASKYRETFRYEDYPEGWEPAAYTRAMDRDGVEATLIYSSATRFNYVQEDAKLQRSIFRSYNEWILDFASYAPKRLFPAPLISILDVDLAAADMREYVNRGCKTVHIPTTITGGGYYDPKYEAIWATAADLGIPISVHSGSSQGKPVQTHDSKRTYDPRQYIIHRPSGPAYGPPAAWEFVSNLIFSGVFDRYPSLKVACSEFEVWDAASTVASIDYYYGRASTYDPEKTINKRWPSEYLHDNVFFGFEDDRAMMLATPLYGADNYLWGSDFPHHMSTWPRSPHILEENCSGLDPVVAKKIGRDNVNKLYKLVETSPSLTTVGS